MNLKEIVDSVANSILHFTSESEVAEFLYNQNVLGDIRTCTRNPICNFFRIEVEKLFGKELSFSSSHKNIAIYWQLSKDQSEMHWVQYSQAMTYFSESFENGKYPHLIKFKMDVFAHLIVCKY